MIFNTLLISIIFPLFFTKISHSSPNPSSYVLNCGNPNPATDSEGRKWRPDQNYLITPENSTSASAQSQDPSLPSSIPYMIARIFPSQTTYRFSISPDQRYWVKFHFYPSSYSDFKPSESYFSVVANNFTLLKNFSALITSQALKESYIIKEFSLTPIGSGSLNITFTPSPESVAFVNGIEVIPMPEIFDESDLIGSPGQAINAQRSVLETMFRLNVGGHYIPASNDSGLSRIWYNDTSYLYGPSTGVTKVAGKNIKITYPNTLGKDIAPIDVYRTSRTMGHDRKINEKYNLTWVLQVDLNFTYVVRLHFCEFEVSKINQRVFDIFINNQTAQKEVDVLAWTDSRQGMSIHKDYAIHVGDKSCEEKMWIALHPSKLTKSEYYNVIINGLEIFKVNDTKGNLAGPNRVISSKQDNTKMDDSSGVFSSSQGNSHLPAIIGGALGGAGILILVIGLFIFFSYSKETPNESRANSLAYWLPIYNSSRSSSRTMSTQSSASSRMSTPRGVLYRHFTLLEIRNATNNFDENEVIGVGGFGKVYKGMIGRGTEVAIKRSNPSSEQGVHEFQTEIDLLSKLRHRHLVSLIGACEEENEMVLVYDYMANGTLRDHLGKNKNKPHLPWRKRLDICIGAAKGIHYLHTGATQTIIHRDVKSTNILLDEKWVAKVSDFGLSKTGISIDNSHVSTQVKGSFGYLDPEYFRRKQLTEKSDVYSFGVVLFEVLCGRAAINTNLPKDQVSLADWAIQNHKRGTINSIIDDNLLLEINPECLNQFVGIAIKCLSDYGIERPSIGSVLRNLELSVQMQDYTNGPNIVHEQRANDAFVIDTTLFTVDEEKDESQETEESSSEPFSMFVNLPGR